MRKNGPAPIKFQTCTCCGLNKSSRKHFTPSRHYETGYDHICLVCRAEAKQKVKPTYVRPPSAKRQSSNNLADAMQTWR